jgi:succinyl-CoA synthetase beta subunit
VAYNDAEAFAAARSYGRNYLRQFYVKAQVQRTARSKGFFRETNFVSGIHRVSSPEEVRDVAGQMCGKHLINKYTQLSGMLCRSVLVMEEVYFTKKFFVNLALDVNSCSPILTYSK